MNTPRDNRTNFDAWFGSPLEALEGNRDAGFIVTIVTFPLLERYVKQTSRAEPNTDAFNDALLKVLPELQDRTTANLFWSVYRHGLLHNVALSKESHGLSHNKPIVEVWPNGQVWLNPDLFAKRVLGVIRSDFATFERGISLPAVSPIAGANGEYTPYLGTGMPPGGRPR